MKRANALLGDETKGGSKSSPCEAMSSHAPRIVRKGKPTAEGFVRSLDSVLRGHDETVQGYAFPVPPVTASQVEVDPGQPVFDVRLRISLRKNSAHFGFLEKIISEPSCVDVTVTDFSVVKFHPQHADSQGALPAADFQATLEINHLAAFGKTDGAGVEGTGRLCRTKRKLIRTLEKKIPLFGEEERKTGEVHPSLIGFGLRKVRIYGQSGAHAGCPLIKQVEPAFEIKIVRAVGREELRGSKRLQVNAFSSLQVFHALDETGFFNGKPLSFTSKTNPPGTLLVSLLPPAEVDPHESESESKGMLRKEANSPSTQVIDLRFDFPDDVPIHVWFAYVGIDQSLTLGSVWIRPEIIPFSAHGDTDQEGQKNNRPPLRSHLFA